MRKLKPKTLTAALAVAASVGTRESARVTRCKDDTKIMNKIRLVGYWAVALFLLSGASMVQASDSRSPVPDVAASKQGTLVVELKNWFAFFDGFNSRK